MSFLYIWQKCRNANLVCHTKSSCKEIVYSFKSSGLLYHNALDRSVSNNRVSSKFLLVLCLKEIPVVNANSVCPDQTPRSAASDQGLHCLPITLLRVSRLKLINRL